VWAGRAWTTERDRGALRSSLRARRANLDIGLDPPVGLLALAGEHGFAWRSPGRTLVTAGVAARIPAAPGAGRLERLAATVAALLAPAATPEGGPVAVGALPFDDATPGELTVPALILEPAPGGGVLATTVAAGADPPDPAALAARLLSAPGRDARARGLGRRDVPGLRAGSGRREVSGLRAGSGRRVTAAGPARAPAPVRLDARWERPGWRAAVTTILEEIAAGHLDKAVLAREVVVEAERPLARAELLRRLAARGAGAYLYASGGFIGASPELLVARSGRVARSRPLAGTVPRGASPAEEAASLAWLRTSAKEALEHRLVVDAVTGGLAKAADRVEVAATRIVRLPTVAHLGTEVTASLGDPPPTALDLVALLHPTPAVAGTPPQAALDLLARLEPSSRGLYAGPVGWVDGAGDGEWAVALRCASLEGRRARLFAGAGIVAGSDPDAEWDETASKLRAMLDVLAP
jgi:isochorismate synthase